MACQKSEAHELAHAAFHVFRGSAVVQDDEGVGAFEKVPRDHQPLFHLVLQADDDEHSRILFAEPPAGLVVGERWADQHDVVELAADRALELVHNKLRFSRVCRPDNQNVEGDVAGVHAAISVSSELDGFQLTPLDIHLGVADCEDVAVHVSGAAPGSLDLQLHPVFRVDEAGPAAVQVLIDHRPQVNQNAELVVRVKLGRIQGCLSTTVSGG